MAPAFLHVTDQLRKYSLPLVDADESPEIAQLFHRRLGAGPEDRREAAPECALAHQSGQQRTERADQQFLHEAWPVGFRKQPAVQETYRTQNEAGRARGLALI